MRRLFLYIPLFLSLLRHLHTFWPKTRFPVHDLTTRSYLDGTGTGGLHTVFGISHSTLEKCFHLWEFYSLIFFSNPWSYMSQYDIVGFEKLFDVKKQRGPTILLIRIPSGITCLVPDNKMWKGNSMLFPRSTAFSWKLSYVTKLSCKSDVVSISQ